MMLLIPFGLIIISRWGKLAFGVRDLGFGIWDLGFGI
jgi:hypothetical protein